MSSIRRKRSSNIKLPLMRKSASPLLVSISATMLLSACGSETMYMYQDVEQCLAAHPQKGEVCEQAFAEAQQQAQQTVSQFSEQSECEGFFGEGQCQYQQQGSGSFWGPMMMGFMVAKLIDSADDYYDYKRKLRAKGGVSNPLFVNKQGQYVDSAWKTYGPQGATQAKVSADTFRAKPSSSIGATRTLARGGFGARVSQSQSWGG